MSHIELIRDPVADPAVRAAYIPADWTASTSYKQGQLVTYLGIIYRANSTFTSGTVFAPANWTALAQARQSALPLYRARAAYGAIATAPMRVLTIGDSKTEGQAASSFAKRWASLIASKIRSRKSLTSSGRGYVPSWYGVNLPATGGFTLTTAAGASSKKFNNGLGLRNVQLVTTGDNDTITVTCSSFDIYYTRTTASGSFTVSIDGSTVATVATLNAGGTINSAKWNSGALTPGSHTVAITWASGGTVFFEGAFFYNGDETSGYQEYDGSHFGFYVNNFLTTTTWRAGAVAVNPHLVIVNLVTNDAATAVGNKTAAQYATDLTTLIGYLQSDCPNASIVIAVPEPRNTSSETGLVEPWANYVIAAKGVANATGCFFWDQSELMPRSGTDTTNLLHTDQLHYNDAGNELVAEDFINRVLNY